MNFSYLLIVATLHIAYLEDPILIEVRSDYNKYASEKVLCEKMIAKLSKVKNNSATHLAYLGAVQTIWANHVFSPISKLNTFDEGRKNIEQAIKTESENVELRFIRLSVQKNAPSFLGYNSNVNEDAAFIRTNLHLVNSTILRNNIDALLEE